jgi:hypothetical protein
VDDEPGQVDGVRGLLDGVAGQIDLHQVRGGDLLEEQPVGVDQEVVLRAGEPDRDVREDEIGHPEVGHEAVDGGEFAAQTEFFRADGGH